MKRRILLLVGLVTFLVARAVAVAETISDVVNEVSQTTYRSYLDNLLYTHTGNNRGISSAQHDLARTSIFNQFTSYGLQTTLSPFTYSGKTYYNVVSTLPGVGSRANETYIIGAHYDSVNNPGADDNASGVAGILEAARVLSQHRFDATLTFVAFDLEEVDLLGSQAYANAHASDNIRGMLSLDMIAYNYNNWNSVELFGRTSSNPLMQSFASSVNLYSGGLTTTFGGVLDESDHAPFEWKGFQAALVIEGGSDYNSRYHKASDSVDTAGYIDYTFATRITRSTVGYLATSAGLAVTDTTLPTATITLPTSDPTYSTTSGTINLGGTASDNVGVTQVTWANNRGGSGTASGTTSWTASGIALLSGENIITVTARDATNNTGSDTITVTYTPQSGSLQVTINPAGAVSAGAQWQVDSGAWKNSGDTVSGLSVGSHTVKFKQITAWKTPANQNVTINNGQTTSATGAYTKPAVTSPVAGSTFNSSTATFSWDAVPGATQYALWVGNAAGTWDLYAGLEPGLSRTVTLPTDGRTLYVRWCSYINGVWQWTDYTYTAYTSPIAEMVTPTPGTTLMGDRVTLEWATVPGVASYALWIGTTANSYNLYAGLETGQSRTVMMPTNGVPLYVTLWTWSNGQWRSNAYTYSAYAATNFEKAVMQSPTGGTTLNGDRVNFQWSSGVGATQHALWVGTTPNSYNLYAAVETGLSRIVKVPTNGGTIYATLWSYINGVWQADTHSYTAYTKPGSETATMLLPAPSSTLTGAATKFSWNSGVGATQRALWVGSNANSYDLYAGLENELWRALMLPKDGRTLYVRLWSLINGVWQWNDYQYTAFGP